jgi:hypothetical protein
MTALGHEAQFLAPSPSGRYPFDQETFSATPGNERDAPIPAIRLAAFNRHGSTHYGHQLFA